MAQCKKYFYLLLGSLSCFPCYSQNVNISANVFTGCLISADNVSFGLTPRNTSKTIKTNITTQCAKNTYFYLNIQGNNYQSEPNRRPTNYFPPYYYPTYASMYPRMRDKSGRNFLPYKMSIDKNSTSKAHIQLSSQDINTRNATYGNWYGYGYNQGTVSVKTLVNQPININLISTIDVPANQASGDYSDTATIILNY